MTNLSPTPMKPSVTYQTDIEGKILKVSPSIEYWTGLKPEQVIGLHAASFYPNPSQRLVLLQTLQQQKQVTDFPIDLLAKNNTIIKVLVSSKILIDEHGSHVGVEGKLREVGGVEPTRASN